MEGNLGGGKGLLGPLWGASRPAYGAGPLLPPQREGRGKGPGGEEEEKDIILRLDRLFIMALLVVAEALFGNNIYHKNKLTLWVQVAIGRAAGGVCKVVSSVFVQWRTTTSKVRFWMAKKKCGRQKSPSSQVVRATYR